MFKHLSNPEYLHVLLNPWPVYGLAMGVLALAIALLTHARAARVTAFSIIFVSALSAWPVYEQGEAAYDRVLAMTDSDGAQWLDEHMHRAEKLIYVFYLVAALSAVAIGVEFKAPRAAVPLAWIVLVLAAGNLGAGGYIAYAGGHIRHKEFRYEPPPADGRDEDSHEH
ncbi:MAG TPA: hypothetical protein VK474_11970 [Chthoniobacterales bacterium]|nr:hypothetical protein [Chthoniobacterales bacterium]